MISTSRCVPDALISSSHTLGQLGLLERENATILNASIRRFVRRFMHSFCLLPLDSFDSTSQTRPVYHSLIPTIAEGTRVHAVYLDSPTFVQEHHTSQMTHTSLLDLSISCCLLLTQNDGTLMTIETAIESPIYTFSSGPTNSMRGSHGSVCLCLCLCLCIFLFLYLFLFLFPFLSFFLSLISADSTLLQVLHS